LAAAANTASKSEIRRRRANSTKFIVRRSANASSRWTGPDREFCIYLRFLQFLDKINYFFLG